jgi:ATP-binding protein involved in chromosome partitioning
MALTPSDVLQVLSQIQDPDKGKDIVRQGLVKDLQVKGTRESGVVSFTLLFKDPGRAFAKEAERVCREALRGALGIGVRLQIQTDSEMVDLGADLIQSSGKRQQPKLGRGVVNTIAVASGKGGVGKSTVAANLAVALANEGYDVGLLDADVYGPSVPTMFGVGPDEKPRVDKERKLVPLEKHGVKLLSMGFLVDPEKAVIWRGPMVSNAVRQFFGDVAWGDLDFLILDLPPGTGDIQLTIVQTVSLTGAVVVSTPQTVALADAQRGVAMFEQVNVPVLGIVENMAFFTPPDLPERRYHLFGEGGARRLSGTLGVPFLGEVPIEQQLREACDEGAPVAASAPESASAKAFGEIAREVARQVTLRNAEQPATQPIEILYK